MSNGHIPPRPLPAPAPSPCTACGKAPARVAFIESDREVEIPSCNCAKPEADTLGLILAELQALRELSWGVAELKTGFAELQPGEGVVPSYDPFKPAGIDELGQPCKPSFTPLDSKVLNAVAAAAGISLDRSVGFSLQFREPALVVAVVEYHVSAEAFAAAIGAISALPKEQQPEPIGMDELGFPIFAEAPSPAEARQPAPPPAGSAPAR